jgi:hypothetical protein
MLDGPQLPPIWIIGFTGHRHLQSPEKVAGALRKVIDSLRAEIPGQLFGCSSIAIGADTLFAEACVAAGIPWIALLPHPEEDFKRDFQESDWKRTSALLERALRVEALSRTRDRDVAYLECGLSTVEESDLMIAVWDGKSPRGTGGTAEVVAHVRNVAKPLVLIDPERLETKRERFAVDVFSDPEMDYLNRLGRHQAARDSPAAPEERVRRFFQAADTQAARIAPRFRRWVGASVIMNALAAILVAAAIAFDLNSYIVEGIILMLLAAAFLSIAVMKRKGAHRNWLRCRVAAEICRSALATWKLPELAAPVWFSYLDGFARLAKSIRLLHLSDVAKSGINVEQWRKEYLNDRIDQQLNYFRRRRRKLAIIRGIFIASFWIFSASAITRALYAALFLTPQSDPLVWRAFHSFLPIALPLAAGCALSLIAIFDLNRQLGRANAMEKVLATQRSQLEKCDDLPTLRRAVENAENAFAADLFEWFTLYKYPRFN